MCDGGAFPEAADRLHAGEGDLTKEQLRERTCEVFTDAPMRQFVLDLAATVRYGGDPQGGLDNDYERSRRSSRSSWSPSSPCLLVHGSADIDVPPDQSEHALAAIPGAERVVLRRHPTSRSTPTATTTRFRRAPRRYSPDPSQRRELADEQRAREPMADAPTCYRG